MLMFHLHILRQLCSGTGVGKRAQRLPLPNALCFSKARVPDERFLWILCKDIDFWERSQYVASETSSFVPRRQSIAERAALRAARTVSFCFVQKRPV